jgi:hypothetical protein
MAPRARERVAGLASAETRAEWDLLDDAAGPREHAHAAVLELSLAEPLEVNEVREAKRVETNIAGHRAVEVLRLRKEGHRFRRDFKTKLYAEFSCRGLYAPESPLNSGYTAQHWLRRSAPMTPGCSRGSAGNTVLWLFRSTTTQPYSPKSGSRRPYSLDCFLIPAIRPARGARIHQGSKSSHCDL